MPHPNKLKKIALIGNPNSGKSSLFNALTGLNQKISNYPGVTVEKKSGRVKLTSDEEIELLDFPGIYSLYPNSNDEKIVIDILTNPAHEDYPDAIVYVAASHELEKHFLLASQLRDLNIPMVFCLTMIDLNKRKGLTYRTEILEDYLNVPVLSVSSLTGVNVDGLKYRLIELIQTTESPEFKNAYSLQGDQKDAAKVVAKMGMRDLPYQNLLIAHHYKWLSHLTAAERIQIGAGIAEIEFNSTAAQIDETLRRYNDFTPVVHRSSVHSGEAGRSWTESIDNIIVHRVFGPVIFFALMFFVFQAIFSWSEAPMTWIEEGFAQLASWVQITLPQGWFTSLLADGVIAGLGGIAVFIPQIVILFLLLTILEEVGYMSRAVFMFDHVMQKFGLNGRSMVALISSGACAIPAIMSTRTIANWKERIITILVAPLISCSARIPVYAILIGFVVPKREVLGIFNLQGIAFMGLYLLGILSALLSALMFKYILKSREKSFLMIELPQYKKPRWISVFQIVREKASSFVMEAGKIILIISIVLWFLASYGPPGAMQNAETIVLTEIAPTLNEAETENAISAARLEASYAGIMGKWIEPAIRPLGFDWKMGIALVTSFAAREVFVGTMATIYSVGSTDNELTLREQMAKEINPFTGGPRYDVATSLSLLLFYVFAMQCMSTLAVTRKETNSWKWPMIQLGFMSVLAYVSSLLAYQFLS